MIDYSNSKPTPLPKRRPTESRTYPICSFDRACNIIERKCGAVYIEERHGKGMNKVIILPEATQELKIMLSYGRRSPMNLKEQKYTGYGHYMVDEDGYVIIIVKHFIEIQTMNRNAVGASNLGPNGENNPGLDFLEYHREEFMKNEVKCNMDAFGFEVDPFLEICGGSEFVLEGHSHPDLGTFYSQTDRVSGSARAASLPVCIFVCDPVRKEMLGSIGRTFADAEVIVYNRDEMGVSEKVVFSQVHPVDEIAKFASQCLRTRGCSGYTRVYTRWDGRACMKLKLIIPKSKGGGKK